MESLTDLDGDGIIGSPGDWEKYLQNNQQSLEKRIAFFRTAADAELRPDNPIHDVLSIESEMASPEGIENVYSVVKELLQRVKAILEDTERNHRHQKTIEEKIGNATQNPEAWKVVLIYKQLRKMEIKFVNQYEDFLSQNILYNQLDCDTSSFVVMAVAHELGLPLALVLVPGHAFLRWQGAGEKFNIDGGKIFSDQHYLDKYNLSKADLKSLTREEFVSDVFHNLALAKLAVGNGSAVDDLMKSLAHEIENHLDGTKK